MAGQPFDIASSALLTRITAQVASRAVDDFVHAFGDTHRYLNHPDQAREQLSRTPRRLPTFGLDQAVREFGGFRFEDVVVEGYDPNPAIKAPIAV